MTYTQTAIFAAGCFWGIQAYFDEVPGVSETVVGYTGGHTEDPTYEEVCMHTTGHAEAVKVTFDPKVVSYHDLVRHFFRMHDPTQINRQGPDVGDSYRSAIFCLDDEQRAMAEHIRDEIQPNYDKPIATQITAAGIFYDAEPYHQKFFQKTGIGGCHVSYAPLKK